MSKPSVGSLSLSFYDVYICVCVCGALYNIITFFVFFPIAQTQIPAPKTFNEFKMCSVYGGFATAQTMSAEFN